MMNILLTMYAAWAITAAMLFWAVSLLVRVVLRSFDAEPSDAAGFMSASEILHGTAPGVTGQSPTPGMPARSPRIHLDLAA